MYLLFTHLSLRFGLLCGVQEALGQMIIGETVGRETDEFFPEVGTGNHGSDR